MGTSQYKLREGFRHFVSVTDEKGAVVSSRRMEAGETVELDDDRVREANLLDRFEKVEGGEDKTVVSIPPDPTRFTRSEKSDHQVAVVTEGDGDETVLSDSDEDINEGAPTEGTNRELVNGAGLAPAGPGGAAAGTSAANSTSAPANQSVGEMTVPQAKTYINSLGTKVEVRKVLDYEKANLQRQGVITAAETRMQQLDK
jgi:hypothetical protein